MIRYQYKNSLRALVPVMRQLNFTLFYCFCVPLKFFLNRAERSVNSTNSRNLKINEA